MKKTEEAMNKPGVMFYFEMRPSLGRLNLKEKGQLFEAILDYAQFGIKPELSGKPGLIWDFIQPKLDRDAERYDRQVEQRKYAVYARDAKKKGEVPMDIDAWRASLVIEKDREGSADDVRYPNYKPQTTDSNPQTTDPIPQTTDCNLQTTDSNQQNNYIQENKRESTKKQVSSELSLFIPPSAEAVREQCRKMGYRVDPVRFVDYYTANGWKIGSSAMQDWRAALKMWNGKEKGSAGDVCSIPEGWTIGTVV